MQSLNINSSNTQFNLNIIGSAKITPYQGQAVVPSIDMNNMDIFTRDNTITPTISHTISARYSTITFNEGELTISRIYNSLQYGRVGINTITPGYSLDIAIGDARKPTGTTWINPSDIRIKTSIADADLIAASQKVSSLRLVSHKWSEEYCKVRKLSNNTTIGFLSQEVEKVFPKSVSEESEFGYSNFKCLDIDQLYKAKFGVTQSLLQKISTLEMRIFKLSKESS
jgi:hypothetical protein